MLRVLIVEDDCRVARVNKGFVEQVGGFSVAGIASTAAEALRLLESNRPDLVILDLYLPDASGLDLLKQMRSGGNPPDVIVVTAAKESAALQKALRAGAIDYILKPYRLERFAGALRRYQEYRNQIPDGPEVEQEEVDRLLARHPVPPATPGIPPKGIDPLTLERVVQALQTLSSPQTAEEFGSQTGLSRTTARRYLEYLVETGRARVQANYGHVGRPERRYGRL